MKKSSVFVSLFALVSVVFGSVQNVGAEQPQSVEFWGENDCKELFHVELKDGHYNTVFIRGREFDNKLLTRKLCVFEGKKYDKHPRYLGYINFHLDKKNGDSIPVTISLPNLPNALVVSQTMSNGKDLSTDITLSQLRVTKSMAIKEFNSFRTFIFIGFANNK